MSDDNNPQVKIAELLANVTNQTKSLDRIEGDLKEWRSEMRQSIADHAKVVDDKLKHDRGNNATKFEALERQINLKADLSDLADNQAKSDERWVEAKAMIETKADKRSELIVYGFIVMILMAFAGLVISDYVNKPAPTPVVQHVQAPPPITSTVTVQRPAE